MNRLQMHSIRTITATGALAALLAACSSVPPAGERDSAARQRAAAAGLAPRQFAAGSLPLQAFVRGGCPGQPLHVYIEGDGHAWVSSTLPSGDPTPVNPVALRLAAGDRACNVAYLGRPGQYRAGQVAPRYWLEARFAPEVIDAYVATIEELAQESAASAVHLAGYSGGGAIAALVAARLAPTHPGLTLRTVAGNLDTQTWARRRRLTPLAASLNPAAAAAALADVPQLHLLGTRDRQVPSYVQEAYLAALPSPRCAQLRRIEAGHAGPWEDAWRQALEEVPACRERRPAFREANPPPRAEKR